MACGAVITDRKIVNRLNYMKKLLIINFAVLISLFFSLSALAQSNAKIEQELVAAINDVKKYSNYGENFDDEKLSKANEVFEAKLLKYTKTPATLSYKFSELDKLMFNATSDDGKFRIYSWDTEDGGTMHNFSRVYQYQGADGNVYSKTDEVNEESGVGSFVTDIFTVDSKTGKIYVVCSTFIASTKDISQSANLYKITGNKLVDEVKLIKTKSGLTDSLSFSYDFFSVVDREERPVRLILYDKNTKRLKIPIVINDKEFPTGRVTNKFITYGFNGTYFVKVN